MTCICTSLPMRSIWPLCFEADSYGAVVNYFEPIMRIGTARVTPMLEYAQAVGLVGK